MKLTAYAPASVQFNKYQKVMILLFALAGMLQITDLQQLLKNNASEAVYTSFTFAIGLIYLSYAALMLFYTQIKHRLEKRGILSLERNSIRFTDLQNQIHEFPIGKDVGTHIIFYTQYSPWQMKIWKDDDAGNELALALSPLRAKKKAELKSLLEHWYRNGAHIREFDALGSRMFLMKSGLEYKEIQEIKKTFNLVW